MMKIILQYIEVYNGPFSQKVELSSFFSKDFIILTEWHRIKLLRISYSTAVQKYKAEGRNTVYADEAYIYSNKMNWQNHFQLSCANMQGKNIKFVLS